MIFAAMSAVAGGCKSVPEPPIITATPETAEIERQLPLRPWVPPAEVMPGETGIPPKLDILTMREAVSRAVSFSPALKGAFAEVEARRADAAQASYRPNPELGIQIENVAGSKSKVGLNNAESTLALSQVIELGDKRIKRLVASNFDTTAAAWDYEVARVQIASEAASLFVDVLASSERLTALHEFAAVAAEIENGVKTRVEGGKGNPIDLDRAMVSTARIQALVRSEKARFEAARTKLSAMWGDKNPSFAKASGQLGQARIVPELAAIRAYLESNPQLARWRDEVGRRYAAVILEQAKAVPDLTVGAGVRQFNEDNSTALVASVSVPLKIFDGNQGNIEAAQRRIAKAEFDTENARSEMYRALADAIGDLAAADAQVSTFEGKILPAAKEAFAKTRTGYQEGRFDFLNVLDTERVLFELRLEAINARADYERARVKAEALIGKRLSDVKR